MAGYSIPTRDELIQFLVLTVRDIYERRRLPATGATLATAVRRRFPGLSYQALGVERLLDVVNLAEQTGAIARVRDVKHLAVLPSGATYEPTRTRLGNARYIRPELWKALVFSGSSRDQLFFERATARFVSVSASRPEEVLAYEKDPRYLKVQPIAQEVQKNWAREFAGNDPDLLPQAESAAWWTDFNERLASKDATRIAEWRRYRARKVVDYARNWADENSILPETIFAESKPPGELRAGPLPVPGGRWTRGIEEDAIRRAVIAAVNNMTIEQLCELSVPIKYILRQLEG